MKTNYQIKCPHCGNQINAESLLAKEIDRIKEKTQKESFFKLKEKEKIIDDLKNMLDTAKRRAEQNSVQLQGENQEQLLIQTLQGMYSTDVITQSKKGANGADVLHSVMDNGNLIGKIYIESKSTVRYGGDWLRKLKNDNLAVHADILVLVTTALPKGIERYGVIDNIIVCGFEYFKELSLILRQSLIKIHSLTAVQKNKENKAEILYRYITSKEFKGVFESIIDGFKTIQESHNSEKVRTLRLWKEREKLLDQILINSIEFYSSVRGIAGTVIPEVKMLEGPQAD